MGGVVLVICSAQTATDGTESEQANIESDKQQADTESGDSSLFSDNQDFFGKSEYNTVGGEFSIRAILAIVFVLALFVIAIYVSKKLLPKMENLNSNMLHILECLKTVLVKILLTR